MTVTVIENFANPALVRALSATWLPPDSPWWLVYGNGKRATKDPSRLPVAANLLLHKMATVAYDDGLFPDLEYLHGAGLHEIPAGGSLGLHLDSERHPVLPWRREASAVLYLDDCDGGELELCDETGHVTERIESRSNRLVLFATPGQWHRVAECRSRRRSLCLFFWAIDHAATGATAATFRE